MPHMIEFKHPVFEYGVREALNKPEGPIMVEELAYFKELDLDYDNYYKEDLEVIKSCTNLERLAINLINRDLPFLNSFPKLKDLFLVCMDEKYAVDFQVFTGLKKLESLTVSGGEISNVDYLNLEALVSLQNLKSLTLHEFGSVDLKPLESMIWLEEFTCGWSNEVKNISSVGKLINLKSLDLTCIEMQNIDFLDTLPDEMSLELMENVIHEKLDMDKLKRFRDVEYYPLQ